MTAHPAVLVLAGPNGAGKSTLAPYLIRDTLGIAHFVNADEIARGLSAYAPESVAFAAGRIMLQRLDELAASRSTFAFETTLSTRSFASFLSELKASGYTTHLAFLSLPSADLAIDRVRRRVALGGHHVPDAIVRRRFHRGIWNLMHIYLQLFDRWRVFDRSSSTLSIIAGGSHAGRTSIHDPTQWEALQGLAEQHPPTTS